MVSLRTPGPKAPICSTLRLSLRSSPMLRCREDLILIVACCRTGSWYCEPSQPHRITSGLKTNFSLSPSSTFHKSLYHNLFLSQTTTQILSTIPERKPRKTITYVLEPIYITRAFSTGTCVQQGDLFILRSYTGTSVSRS